MSNLIIFEEQNVRILNEDGTPWDGHGEAWFVPKEVAQAIGASEPRIYANKILNRNPEKFEGFLGVTKLVTPGGVQEATIINENGLYMFLMASDLPAAITFQRKVTEILKQIRKTGKYNTAQPEYQNENLRAAMEIFRSLDINNMKAPDRAAFFKMVGNSFGTPRKKADCINAPVGPNLLENTKLALAWVKEMYEKYGSEFGVVQGNWMVIRRYFWRGWAKQNNLNLTVVLRDLYRQGIIQKFYNNTRYSKLHRVNGDLVQSVFVDRELAGLSGAHLTVVKPGN